MKSRIYITKFIFLPKIRSLFIVKYRKLSLKAKMGVANLVVFTVNAYYVAELGRCLGLA